MIITGCLERMSDATVNVGTGAASLDSLEVTGHGEIRDVRGTRYLFGHLSDAMGQQIVLGMVDKTVVALRYGDKFYKDTSFINYLQMSFGCLSILVTTIGIWLCFIPPIIQYIRGKRLMNQVADEVERRRLTP